ncbi:MAG: type I restriction enzyme HsdR N-terminal domain-containing protein [Methylobacteriaceae bacterium]|nr:type I restriction enzyme HsdR N-terminal domain-containing protein [Methylobacteriaceae bacterium]
MPLTAKTIGEIVERLKTSSFPNESAISQGVVLSILQNIGWDIWDTRLVWPEYKTGEGRADFALCNPPGKPAVFIEVKQPGKAEEGVKQVLQYAFDTGVPFVALTDGQTWRFYLPAEQGNYEERQVQMLDLYERPAEDAIEIFKRYLEYERVIREDALEDARREYRRNNKRSEARNALKGVWEQLIKRADPGLVELLANAVESHTGNRPEEKDTQEFLQGLVNGPAGAVKTAAAHGVRASGTPEVPRPATEIPGKPAQGIRSVSVTLKGEQLFYPDAKSALVDVVTRLSKYDRGFLDRYARHPDMHGRKCAYLGKSPEAIYPGMPKRQQYVESLPQSWMIGTHCSNAEKYKWLKIAAEVAGLKFGADLIVDFPNT